MRHAVVFLFLFGCICDCPVPEILVSDYFPLKKGVFHIYQVDSVVVNQNVETAYSFQLKTEVTDSFRNATGGYTYVLSRAKRQSPALPWTAINAWSARADRFQVTVNEGNVSYIRLMGPLYPGRSWNGNTLNILGGTEKCPDSDAHTCDLYELGELGKAFSLPSNLTFENTAPVIENDNGDIIVAQDKRSEVYAAWVGLIYREITHLEYCTDPSCLGTQFVAKGLKYKQSLLDYGGI